MSQTLRGTEGKRACYELPDRAEAEQSLKALAVAELGRVDNLDFYPRSSNPFGSRSGYRAGYKHAYKLGER